MSKRATRSSGETLVTPTDDDTSVKKKRKKKKNTKISFEFSEQVFRVGVVKGHDF